MLQATPDKAVGRRISSEKGRNLALIGCRAAGLADSGTPNGPGRRGAGFSDDDSLARGPGRRSLLQFSLHKLASPFFVCAKTPKGSLRRWPCC